MNLKRGRYDEALLDRYISDLTNFKVNIDERTELVVWTMTAKLALKHKLTSYDACYLELAIRLDAPLATLDGDLRRAASAEGIALLGM